MAEEVEDTEKVERVESVVVVILTAGGGGRNLQIAADSTCASEKLYQGG